MCNTMNSVFSSLFIDFKIHKLEVTVLRISSLNELGKCLVSERAMKNYIREHWVS